MDFLWRSFVFGFRLPLMFICILHELYLRLVFGFEHLVCNVWWTMLVCITLIYLCSSCGCEVVLTKLKFISYIYLVSCMPRFPLVGETPSKLSNLYICALGIHSNLYAHIKGEFSLLIELRWIYSYHIWNFQGKLDKFFQSLNSSPPYVLCIK